MRIQIGLAAVAILSTACDFNTADDYNPKKDYEQFLAAKQEKKSAGTATETKVDPVAAAIEAAKKDYGVYCSSCHGADGKAATAMAAAMNPKPRDLTDASWQGSVDDAHIFKVIKEGGAAVGLSVTMAPWGAALNDEKIDGLVKYLRSIKQ